MNMDAKRTILGIASCMHSFFAPSKKDLTFHNDTWPFAKMLTDRNLPATFNSPESDLTTSREVLLGGHPNRAVLGPVSFAMEI